jgi:hypothetical protein
VNTTRVPPLEHLNLVLHQHSKCERKEILTPYAHHLEKSLASIIYDFRIDYRTGRNHITLVTQEPSRPSRSLPTQQVWVYVELTIFFHLPLPVTSLDIVFLSMPPVTVETERAPLGNSYVQTSPNYGPTVFFLQFPMMADNTSNVTDRGLEIKED